MLSPQLESILRRVQNNANYMPKHQLENVMKKELGDKWNENFDEFNEIPIAAASIGQVHFAKHKTINVAVKVQYPGVASSINSDLDNLKSLLVLSNLLPKGLYLDNTIRVAREELQLECDYKRELLFMNKFRDLIESDQDLNSRFYIPKVFESISTTNILVTEYIEGIPLGQVVDFPLEIRNEIVENLLKLCLKEIFIFQMMQSDPNWTNFLYRSDGVITLLDFGATREYSTEFIDGYLKLLYFASINNVESCIEYSIKLGFLTGLESVVFFCNS